MLPNTFEVKDIAASFVLSLTTPSISSLKSFKFTRVVIDNANRLTECAAVMPLLKNA